MRKLRKRKIVAVSGIILLLLMTYMGKTQICYGQQEEETVLPKELDLGDYTETMTVGERQLLYVTVLPETATEKNIAYTSSASAVATINSMGRITAISAGTTVITAKCGLVTEEFTLTVKEAEEQTEETKTEVTAIEVADYEEELEVDKTMTLSATVLPSDATDATVTYYSGNAGIATVTSTGEVKGIAPGQVIITLTAGNISKDIHLTVKVKTEAVQVNSTYVVLKKGETFLLKAKVVPEEADQSLTYKSADPGVASVSGRGEIHAEATGSTTIIVSGKDMSNAVTVIVNDTGNAEGSENISEVKEDSTLPVTDRKLLELLTGQDIIVIQAEEYWTVSRNILRELYERKKTIRIEDDGYTITLSGEEIVNCQNELYLPMEMEKTGEDIKFILNAGKNLPGKIRLSVKDADNYKYVYLYNEAKGKYEQIQVEDAGEMDLDIAGKYKLTRDKIGGMSVSLIAAGTGSAVVVVLAAVYLVMKRKYLFW